MEIKWIDNNTTDVRFSNKKEEFAIEQMKFFGREPYKQSSLYSYFRFNNSFEEVTKYLGY
ncbi:MAG: hypothetical protein ACRDA4_08115 [Filifactoraceae bacterium]